MQTANGEQTSMGGDDIELQQPRLHGKQRSDQLRRFNGLVLPRLHATHVLSNDVNVRELHLHLQRVVQRDVHQDGLPHSSEVLVARHELRSGCAQVHESIVAVAAARVTPRLLVDHDALHVVPQQFVGIQQHLVRVAQVRRDDLQVGIIAHGHRKPVHHATRSVFLHKSDKVLQQRALLLFVAQGGEFGGGAAGVGHAVRPKNFAVPKCVCVCGGGWLH